MRVLHLSTTDVHGGAGRAAHRIHLALLEAEIESRMAVQAKSGDEWRVSSPDSGIGRLSAVLATRLKRDLSRRFFRPQAPFSTQLVRGSGASAWQHSGADVLNLHWICDGFLGIGDIGRMNLPMVWTCHDQWPFTGGCHYSGDCDRFEKACGKCPVIGARSAIDVSHRVLKAKSRRWRELNLAVAAPSQWMADQAARSALFRDRHIRVIHNPIDLELFQPLPRDEARAVLGLEASRPILLFAAMSATSDRRKGYDLLTSTLDALGSMAGEVELVVIGASEPESPGTSGRRVRYLGRLHDDAALALAYSAADVFVAPSREDNLPNTVAESLACGTPVAAFRVGGIPEMVHHRRNGVLAEPFDTTALARGINELLDDEQPRKIAAEARRTAERLFDPRTVAAAYGDLYRSLIDSGPLRPRRPA